MLQVLAIEAVKRLSGKYLEWSLVSISSAMLFIVFYWTWPLSLILGDTPWK
jgi:hypothetical protein